MKEHRYVKQQQYDLYSRNRESKKFYESAAWRKLRLMKLGQSPICECCELKGRLIPATTVHHSISIKRFIGVGMDMMYLKSLCAKCHNIVETELRNQGENERNTNRQ